MTNNLCIVFVCNKAYFDKFVYTCSQLVSNGQYTGDICLVIGNDLLNDKLLKCDVILNNNVHIKHFPDITFTSEFFSINNTINSDNRNKTKKFQWHKLHLFNVFFKKWDYVFYLDCGITIFSNIEPLINSKLKNTLCAHSDTYPEYKWKLSIQFDTTSLIYEELSSKFNLNIDYFQTTMMLYDTNIIEQDTFNNMYELSIKYPISKTNEQGIMALYFTNIKPCFKQIKLRNGKTHFYDYLSRNETNKYIMLKST